MDDSDGDQSESSLSSEMSFDDAATAPPPKRRRIGTESINKMDGIPSISMDHVLHSDDEPLSSLSSDLSDDLGLGTVGGVNESNGTAAEREAENVGPTAVTGVSLAECILNEDSGVEMPSTVAARKERIKRKMEERQRLETADDRRYSVIRISMDL